MRLLLAPLLLALLLPALAPLGAASDTVAVTLRFGVGHDLQTNRACVVHVAPGADAIAVLDAAIAEVCITSYARSGAAGATRLTCLNALCETYGGVLGWSQFHDGALAPRHLEAFSAAEGAILGFAYGVMPR